jgi:hypothetical protein
MITAIILDNNLPWNPDGGDFQRAGKFPGKIRNAYIYETDSSFIPQQSCVDAGEEGRGLGK